MSKSPEFYYGGFTFNPGEVTPVKVHKRTHQTNRNCRYITTYTHHHQGVLTFPPDSINATSADIASRITAIENALLFDYEDWGYNVYDPDDNPIVVHEMQNDDEYNLSGNRIVEFSWRNDIGPMELANGGSRSFDLVLASTWESAYANLIDGEETFEFIGSGGPVYEWIQLFSGDFVRKQVAASTWQTIVQVGFVTYMRAYGPQPAPPIALASFEDERSRIIKKHTPIFWGNYKDPKYRVYRTDYQFVYRLPPNYALEPAVFM